MNAAPDRLILFTRWPEPGTTKTRLIPLLGPEGAAEFQRRLTARAAQAAAAVRSRRGLAVEIRHAGGTEDDMRQWLGGGFRYRAQGRGDVGARMAACLRAAFEEGAERAVLIGADIPALTPAILERAFDALRRCDLVFGPAADGGYYLIGATAAGLHAGRACLEPGIAWGTSGVLARTLAMARAANLTCRLLETLADVDGPDDLPAAMRALCGEEDRPAISVVIPALNEAGQLGQTLSGLAPGRDIEVIVADGGSTDATLEIARAAGARALALRAPRSLQMNAGAAAAAGDLLLFLHADTRLPGDFRHHIREASTRPGAAAGAFRLRIDAAGRGLRLIERAANWRARRLQMPYGDQALFMRRDIFWESGAYLPIPIMEDFELVRRLRRRGRIVLAAGSAATSARRWQRIGPMKTWLINQRVVIGYCLGVAPQRLAAWYRPKRR
jgi:hypothetical protein